MLSQTRQAFEASWNRGGKMLIFIEIIGEYDNWTHSARFCLLNEAGFAENMINHGISAKLQNRISTEGRTAVWEERMTILNKRKKAR